MANKNTSILLYHIKYNPIPRNLNRQLNSRHKTLTLASLVILNIIFFLDLKQATPSGKPVAINYQVSIKMSYIFYQSAVAVT